MGLLQHWWTLARDTVIDQSSETAAARDAIVALDEQEKFAELLEQTLTHSVSDLIDLEEADALQAMASVTVA